MRALGPFWARGAPVRPTLVVLSRSRHILWIGGGWDRPWNVSRHDKDAILRFFCSSNYERLLLAALGDPLPPLPTTTTNTHSPPSNPTPPKPQTPEPCHPQQLSPPFFLRALSELYRFVRRRQAAPPSSIDSTPRSTLITSSTLPTLPAG